MDHALLLALIPAVGSIPNLVYGQMGSAIVAQVVVVVVVRREGIPGAVRVWRPGGGLPQGSDLTTNDGGLVMQSQGAALGGRRGGVIRPHAHRNAGTWWTTWTWRGLGSNNCKMTPAATSTTPSAPTTPFVSATPLSKL